MWTDFMFPIGYTGKMTQRRLAKFKNAQTFQNLFAQYLTAACDVFEWSLPDTCSERVLEMGLVLRGSACFVQDGETGAYLTLPASMAGLPNVNGDPLEGWAYGFNGYNRPVKYYTKGMDVLPEYISALGGYTGDASRMYNAVYCRDNAMSYPLVLHMVMYIERMADSLRSIDTAVHNLKVPYIIKGDQSEVRSILDQYRSATDNEPIIVSSGPENTLDILQTGVDPSVLDAMWQNYQRDKTELNEILGLNAQQNLDKNENLTIAEVTGNKPLLDVALSKRLEYRKKFCDTVNEAFPGVNVSVKLRHETEMEEVLSDDDGLVDRGET